MKEKIMLVDGNSLLYRAFYALPLLQSSRGVYTNGVYGFFTMFNRILAEENPSHVVVAFDKSRDTFRQELYKEYKAKRLAPPDELKGQFGLLREVLKARNICYLELDGYEADDIIGTYASHGCIRMFNRDVEKLYPLVPWGCRVKIVNDGKMVPEQIKPVELKKKSSGQRVVYVQSRLKELGVEFDGADGRFGNMTELAVKYFQVWHGLEPSGIVDEATYRALGLIE
jgi:hypothetical protein